MAKRGGKNPDIWLHQQKSMARAEEQQRLDNIGVADESGQMVKKNCGNCRKKKHCKLNTISTVGGAASVGGRSSTEDCGQWAEQKKGGKLTDKQQKNLLKQFKKLTR